MKKKILKIAIIIIAILLLVFIIHTIRNYVIITGLQSKIVPYKESTNYHIKSIATANMGTVTKMDYYKKSDNKQLVVVERNLGSEITKMSMYDNGERVDMFIETEDLKTVRLNCDGLMEVKIYNDLETDNKLQTLLGCVNAKIRKINYNGKECYSIKGFMSSQSLSLDFEDTELYIEKETGLFLKTISAGIVNEREYEFNNVDDSIFIEPNIGEYKLLEN